MERWHRACKDLAADRLRASHVGAGSPRSGRVTVAHDLDLHALGFCVTNRKASEYATHFVLEKVAIQS
jgi:hypothetical protein